jgi:hypothetical protein
MASPESARQVESSRRRRAPKCRSARGLFAAEKAGEVRESRPYRGSPEAQRACGLAMAEPLAAPSLVAEAERDVLLATKLHMPGSRPDLVPRPRLVVRLDRPAYQCWRFCRRVGAAGTSWSGRMQQGPLHV